MDLRIGNLLSGIIIMPACRVKMDFFSELDKVGGYKILRQKRSCVRIMGGEGDIIMGFLLLDYDASDVYENGQNGRCSDEE
jgi:hypothetical protein